MHAAVDAALAAIASAGDTAALKQVRTAHTGETSPLAQLNAELRDVAPTARPSSASSSARPAVA